MNPEDSQRPQSLSPISRRAFFQRMGARALKLGVLGAAAASAGQDGQCNIGVGDADGWCGYCNGAGSDYDHCDGDYCDYANYGDTGDAGVNCGYCDGPGSDYDHCDGDYCDYANYGDAGV